MFSANIHGNPSKNKKDLEFYDKDFKKLIKEFSKYNT